jgi:hypothetical protein
MVRRKVLAIVVVAVTSLLPVFVQAGGLSLYEIAISDVGLVGAGRAAPAQDLFTLVKNPESGSSGGSGVGQFPGTYMNVFQVSFIWGSVAKG